MALLLFFPVSCHYLDYNEEDNYTAENVWSQFWPRVYGLSNDLYANYLPTDFSSVDGAMRSSATDDAVHVLPSSGIYGFNNGSWSAINPIDDVWGKMYAGIRAANLFIANTKGQTWENERYGSDGYDQVLLMTGSWPYEARFLRAFFYFELIKRYHNVPLITTVLTPEDANNVASASFNDVLKFIVAECDTTSNKLPVNYNAVMSAETGRATRGAALALKARMLLYAASPLYNPSNDNQKWIDAAKAAKVIIDEAAYTLETNYTGVVNKITSAELIFDTRQGASNSFESANFPIGYVGGNTGTCPTQNLVDSYEMKANGLGINDAGSGYNPATPYVGRDPRFAATILYNGATWKSLSVQVWYGGLNAPPANNATLTGYYLKKYVIEAVKLDPIGTTTAIHDWVNFRYGEVLLNYAEAMNEAYGPEVAGPAPLTMTARTAVNLIRTRATMPAFPAGMTQTDFRTKLRNERRVELAFEDHRFWDVRRWKIGNTTTAIYGVDVVKDASNNIAYTRKLVEQRVWDDRMYLYPIPASEVFINSKLTQNPGW